MIRHTNRYYWTLVLITIITAGVFACNQLLITDPGCGTVVGCNQQQPGPHPVSADIARVHPVRNPPAHTPRPHPARNSR